MSKLFRVEEGNVLREFLPQPEVPKGNELWQVYLNRESYPYVSPDWKVGDLKELDKDFIIVGDDNGGRNTEIKKIAVPIVWDSEDFLTPISKPKKED